MNTILDKIGEIGIVPVVVIDNEADALPLGQALLDAGLPCAEITFRTAAAPSAVKILADNYPDLIVGVGTILTPAQAETAVAAGAKFIVTPGFDAAVVDWCLANDVPITPGVMTPTDINQAIARGINLVKFFPAEAAGGIKALKAIGAPYVGVKFIPTGGINPNNLADYLNVPSVLACGGSFMVKKQLIADGQFDTIREAARGAVEIVKATRSA